MKSIEMSALVLMHTLVHNNMSCADGWSPLRQAAVFEIRLGGHYCNKCYAMLFSGCLNYNDHPSIYIRYCPGSDINSAETVD